MAGETYRIQYKSLDDLEFKSRASVEKYLKEEEAVWREFLLWFINDEKLASVGLQVRNFGRSFGNVLSNLENATGFNRQFPFSRSNVLLPPPSRTLVGQLTLGLFNNGNQKDAVSVYLCFISLEAHTLPGNLKGRKEQGAALVAGAKAAEALPFHQISSQKRAGAARMAEAHAAAMAEEVEGAERERETLTETMSHMAESWSRTFETNQKLVEVREERQSVEFDLSLKEFKSTFDGEMIQIEESFRARMSEHALEQEAHGARYEELLDKFLVQMQYRAPVKLWGDRQEGHIEASGKAFKRFIGFACVAVLIALLVPFFAGDYIAASFYQTQGTEQVFSVKDP
ncbi:hypothetical protein [Halocynthiibacter styelae]|uniref:Uncharacterized protein n=1 Tax=Halocynthiibacter styelae TaxID=2761955 RepID=A0A8J7IWU1_9RHOB|nr:hypothetical protein [Paenihalocynthiibacter styelae]MBI1493375.1 hypothetical protein [Paenihalocynthiibacter styelae]